MAECKPCCRRSSIDDPTGAGVSRKRDQGGVLQRLQLDFLGAREPVPHRQHDIKGLYAKALRCEWLRHVRDISESKIRQAAMNVILDVALNALAEVDFDSREMAIVFRDDPGESEMSERHDARHDDLTSPLFSELAHVLDANLKIVEQPLREVSKLLPRFSNRNLTRAAGEQRGAKSALNLLDSSRKRRLRRLQECGGGNEAAILRDSKNRAKLT